MKNKTSNHTPAPAYFVWPADNVHHEDPQDHLVTCAAKLSFFVQQFQKLLDKTEPWVPEERFGMVLLQYSSFGIYWIKKESCVLFFSQFKIK